MLMLFGAACASPPMKRQCVQWKRTHPDWQTSGPNRTSEAPGNCAHLFPQMFDHYIDYDLPHIIIAGAQKAGTTWLRDKVLAYHPEVKVCAQEMHFFDRVNPSTGRVYAHMMEHLNCSGNITKRLIIDADDNGKATLTKRRFIVDKTPSYMAVPAIAERIATVTPRVKLIFVLRNPVDRAYSNYCMSKRKRKPLGCDTFEECIGTELSDLIRSDGANLLTKSRSSQTRWVYHSSVQRGFYVDQLREFDKWFSQEQMHIVIAEELWSGSASAAASLSGLLRFLNLSSSDAFARRMRQVVAVPQRPRSYAPMSPRTRVMLEAIYRPYNHRLCVWMRTRGAQCPSWAQADLKRQMQA